MNYAYVITAPCVGEKDHACVDVCPVDCIYDAGDQLIIHPDECIGCAACVPECPVDAIFPPEDVPEKWQSYIAKNAMVRDHPEIPRALGRGEYRSSCGRA